MIKILHTTPTIQLNPMIKHTVFLILSLSGVFCQIAPAIADQPVAPEGVAAELNGRQIKISDLDLDIKRNPALSIYLSKGAADENLMRQVRILALDRKIKRQLLLDAAKKSGKLKEDDVQAQTKKLVDSYKTQTGGDKEFEAYLKSNGTDPKQFEADVADDFRISSYIKGTVTADVKVGDDEIKKAFEANPAQYTTHDQQEAVHARHILVKVAQGAAPEIEKAAKDKIDSLYEKATTGKGDFAALANENSDDPGSAKRGGDLGFFNKGMMVPEFEQAAFSTKPGEISKPIKTPFGYHIIKVEEHREAKPPTFEQAKDRVAQQLKAQQEKKLVDDKIAELKKSSQLKIYLEAKPVTATTPAAAAH
jgi:parvulin-like peptidyl-prolyl isomerase